MNSVLTTKYIINIYNLLIQSWVQELYDTIFVNILSKLTVKSWTEMYVWSIITQQYDITSGTHGSSLQ